MFVERTTDADDGSASEAARALAGHRWGNRVVSRAVEVVVERQDQLDDAQRSALREIAGEDDE